MPNVLKVTTPGAGFDNNSIKSNPQPGQRDIQVQVPVDPSRVTRGDNRKDQGQDQGGNLEFHYESNFHSFVKLMKSAPSPLDLMGELLFSGLGGTDSLSSLNGLSPAFQEALVELMELSSLTPEQMKGFLKEQIVSSNRFSEGFFSLLRQAADKTTSATVKGDILRFLQHYNDMSSGPHLLHQIRTLTESIGGKMFQKGQEQLEENLKDMNWEAPPGDIWKNASVLKEKVLPALSRYISLVRDMGPIRDEISYLSVLISHYENGSLEEVIQSFDRMSAYPDVKQFLGNLTEEQLREALKNMDLRLTGGMNGWSEQLQTLLKEGNEGGAGLEKKPLFLNLVHSMLLNESVYMPLLHAMFPINIGGRQMMTEVWVDPDQDGGTGADGRPVPMQKVFARFDISRLGSFDLIVICREKEASVQLRYPETLSPFEDDIRTQVGQIALRNGYRINQMALETGKKPFQVMDVFPEIYEKRRTVNVRV